MYKSKIEIEIIDFNGEQVEAKSCKECEEIKPLTDFFKQKGGLGGVRARCKVCWYSRHKEKLNQRSREWQQKNKEKVKEYNREWTKANRERINERERNRYKENPDLFKERRQIKYQRDPEAHKQYQYTYRERHKEKHLTYQRAYYKGNKEIFLESNKKYMKVNREVVRARTLRRRARKKSLPDDLTAQQYKFILERFDYKCALSGQKLEVLDLDHFIPLATGWGGTTLGNMIPLSPSLNSSKQDRNPFEWIKRKDIQEVVSLEKFQEVVEYLAEINDMTPDEYKEYVDDCFANPIFITENNL
ncbi:hypothetical protein SAMN04488137_1601 [Fictibacillus solisalsi]|uniref:HNH nuclease domain-containing protein n=1 Tax=Fictibacillus solisalsi TaxID=459525 RepID=A0A1G9VI80_9BACL|nr:HNH endonuclease [Fictibacillus solisalsi]SDM71810.1 hypothetical protein SAMN04488137_1601 [Fictibacillus solisalsi]